MAVSIDAQAAINEIARDLDRGVDGYRASADPDPVIGFSSPSTQFGDEEFVHEIGMYGISDPLLRAALREFGASIASVAPQSRMQMPGALGESKTKFHHGFFSSLLPKDVYSRISEEQLDLPPTWPHRTSPTGKQILPSDREFLNDLWRHEYRHQGMDILRDKQYRSPLNKTLDFLGTTLTAPIDYKLQSIFNPSKVEGALSKIFGLSESRKYHDEEALLRVLDTRYGLSDTYPTRAASYLRGMARRGLINDPSSWNYKFIEGDPNNILAEIKSSLEGNP